MSYKGVQRDHQRVIRVTRIVEVQHDLPQNRHPGWWGSRGIGQTVFLDHGLDETRDLIRTATRACHDGQIDRAFGLPVLGKSRN